MEWISHGERPIYESEWVSLSLVDVEVPGHRRFEQHAVKVVDAAGALIVDPDKGVLMLWRHRVLSNTWGWEIPAGRIDPGETAISAANRECLEESGWQPGPLRELFSYMPVNGISATRFHVFMGSSASLVGEPSDPTESTRVEWLDIGRLRDEIAAGKVGDGFTLTACCYALAFES